MVSSINLDDKISQTGAAIYAADAQGNDTYVIALTPTLTAYTVGMVVNFKANTVNVGAATLNIDGLGAIPILKKNNQVLGNGDIEADQMVTVIYDTARNFQMQSQLASAAAATGIVLQMVNVTDGAFATGNTIMPYDDTIPQITEGDEYMTLAITPANANNLLKIDIAMHLSGATAAQAIVAALFQDATAGALAATSLTNSGAGTAGYTNAVYFTHYMIAGTVVPTTFRVRAGTTNGAAISFNGYNGARILGGVSSSTITIQEFRV